MRQGPRDRDGCGQTGCNDYRFTEPHGCSSNFGYRRDLHYKRAALGRPVAVLHYICVRPARPPASSRSLGHAKHAHHQGILGARAGAARDRGLLIPDWDREFVFDLYGPDRRIVPAGRSERRRGITGSIPQLALASVGRWIPVTSTGVTCCGAMINPASEIDLGFKVDV